MAVKKDIIAAVAKLTKSKTDITTKIINGMLDVISETLSRGEDVTITGYLSIKPVYKEAHEARNPQTSKIVQVPGKYRVVTKAGKTWIESANQVK